MIISVAKTAGPQLTKAANQSSGLRKGAVIVVHGTILH
jgi:hypothetical protein